MDLILKEIQAALDAKLWYAALAVTVTLPDICASLEAPPGASKDKQRSRYLRWFNTYAKRDAVLTADRCWDLRCGVSHEGKYKPEAFERGREHRVGFPGAIGQLVVSRERRRQSARRADRF